MKKLLIIGVIVLMATIVSAANADMADNCEVPAIKQACLDYVEGFFESNKERIERGVNGDLVKRQNDKGVIKNMTRQELVAVAVGNKWSKPEIKVDVYDVHGNIALAKVTSQFVDYCELAKIDGRWQVLNVLWDF